MDCSMSFGKMGCKIKKKNVKKKIWGDPGDDKQEIF